MELRSCRGKTGRVSSQGRDDTLGYAALEYYADPRTSTVAVFDPDEFQAEQGLTDGGSAQSSGRSTMVLERLYPWRSL